jgi:hypothetical protein
MTVIPRPFTAAAQAGTPVKKPNPG